MKKTLLIIFVLCTSIWISAQAPVPFTWGFPNTTLPAGFTMGTAPGGATYLPAFYASNGNIAAPSVKLSGTNHFLTINFAAEAGVISYFLKGQNVGGAPFQGTIDIEFSDNGTTWNSVRTLTNTDISTTAYTQFKDTCAANTRYVRFFYTLKVSGVNLSLDDIEISSPLAKPDAEINALIGTDTIFSGSNYYTSETVSNTKRINIIIENQGTDSTLKINSVTSSNNSEFVVVSSPLTVDSLSNDTIKIDFTPSAAGTRTSVLTIANNDATENPYIINLIGYGNGLASQPSVPSGVAFSNVTTYNYDVTIAPSTPLSDESYVVLFRKGSAPTGVPVDGTTYSAGESIGNAKVAYVGKNLTYSSKETYADTKYFVSVFSFSGFGSFSNYNPVGLIDSVTTPVTMQSPVYYTGIIGANTTFIQDIHAKINPHTLRFYGDYDETYIDEFASRDTTQGRQVVTCVYTGDEYIYSPPFNFSYISREHSFPQSWMPTYGVQTLPEYNDYHNLYPTNQNNANAVRSNRPLGEVVTVTSSFKDGKYGIDANGKAVYEPRDDHKGNAARAIFYMSVAYTGVSGNNWALPNPIDPFIVNYAQDQDILKKWHWQDPVDEKEMARNDYIESLQNNRNPFIDSMNYACYIDFMTMTWLTSAAPCLTTPVSIEETSNLLKFSLFPNPANSIIHLTYSIEKSEKLSYTLINSIGQTIETFNLTGSLKETKTIHINHLPTGVYQLVLTGESFSKTIKFIKE